jgi:uncharacterized membrane protein YjgN (DUF898 family)
MDKYTPPIYDTLVSNEDNLVDNESVQPKSEPTKTPIHRPDYDGDNLEVMRIKGISFLLSLVTLGIYSFWGKTKMRRYMTSQITLLKNRFEYTGTAKDLLVGTLKALIVFAPIIFFLSVPIMNVMAFVLFLGVLSTALFLSLRYRLANTKWRGFRFGLNGSTVDFFAISFKRALINVVTLGWKIPKSDIIRWDYIANNMSYGPLKFSYQGDESRLKKVHAISLVFVAIGIMMAAIPLINAGVLFANEAIQTELPGFSSDQNNASVSDNQNTVDPFQIPTSNTETFLGLFIFFGPLMLGLTVRMWYRAALWQERIRGLRLDKLKFKSDVTGAGMAKLFITNFLLIIFTLGLARQIAKQRVLRYHIENLRIAGDIKSLLAELKASKTSAKGDDDLMSSSIKISDA